MKIIYKIILPALLAAMALALSACGSDKTDKDSKNDTPVELTFVRIGNDKGEADYWKGLIERFEKENANIKILYDDAAIGEPMETKLTTMFMANMGPDIIGHGIMSVASRVEAGQYVPITKYYEGWEGKDDIMPNVLANGTYKDEIYGLAYSTTPYIFAYRKDFFADAGLPDKAPETWDELAEYAEKLTIKNGNTVERAGFAFPMTAGNFVEYDVFVFTNGGRYYNDTDILLNTPDKVEAFEFLRTIVNDYNLPYNNNEVNPFLTGSAAMTLINNVALRPMLADPEYDGKVGIAVPPSNTAKASFSGCNMLFIGRDCKNPDDAFKFIEMAVSVDEVLQRSTELNIPVTRSSAMDSFIAMDPMNAVRAECVSVGIGMPLRTWAPTFQRVRNELVQNILYTDIDIQTALNEAQAELEAEAGK